MPMYRSPSRNSLASAGPAELAAPAFSIFFVEERAALRVDVCKTL
jgi:hypothetical protein